MGKRGRRARREQRALLHQDGHTNNTKSLGTKMVQEETIATKKWMTEGATLQVTIKREDWDLLTKVIKAASKRWGECSWLGIGKSRAGGGWDIVRIVYPKQENSGGASDIDDAAFAEVLAGLQDEERVIWWGHSHGSMGVFYSTKDETTWENFISTNPSFFIGTCHNAAQEVFLRVYTSAGLAYQRDKLPPGACPFVRPGEIPQEEEDDLVKAAMKEMTSFSQRGTSFGHGTQRWLPSGGEKWRNGSFAAGKRNRDLPPVDMTVVLSGQAAKAMTLGVNADPHLPGCVRMGKEIFNESSTSITPADVYHDRVEATSDLWLRTQGMLPLTGAVCKAGDVRFVAIQLAATDRFPLNRVSSPMQMIGYGNLVIAGEAFRALLLWGLMLNYINLDDVPEAGQLVGFREEMLAKLKAGKGANTYAVSDSLWRFSVRANVAGIDPLHPGHLLGNKEIAHRIIRGFMAMLYCAARDGVKDLLTRALCDDRATYSGYVSAAVLAKQFMADHEEKDSAVRLAMANSINESRIVALDHDAALFHYTAKEALADKEADDVVGVEEIEGDEPDDEDGWRALQAEWGSRYGRPNEASDVEDATSVGEDAELEEAKKLLQQFHQPNNADKAEA